MSRFIEGENRYQSTLFPEALDDYVADGTPPRIIDLFIDKLDISGLGFKSEPAETGRPGYHPRTMLKLYVYGYLNQVHSSRRLEREAQRNVELMWLTGRLAPDHKTIANFRKDNGEAIRLVCREFVMQCRQFGLLADALVAIDGAYPLPDENDPQSEHGDESSCSGLQHEACDEHLGTAQTHGSYVGIVRPPKERSAAAATSMRIGLKPGNQVTFLHGLGRKRTLALHNGNVRFRVQSGRPAGPGPT